MKHSIKSFLLTVLVTLVSVSASAANYDFEVDGMYYNVLSLSDLTCEVTLGDVKYTGDVKIPSTVTYNGKTLSVTSIGEKAFDICTSLTSVDIPNGVTSIGDDAFYVCSKLTSIDIPNGVTSIGNNAFYKCTSLTSIDIPNSVTSIGSSAFYGCTSLTSAKLGSSVTSIGESAFLCCTSLTSINLPNSVTSIENYAFKDCTSLTSIAIGNSVTSIGSRAFYGCTSLTSANLPSSLTSIGDEAFKGCTLLETFNIPNSVVEIGDGVLVNSGIKSLVIGKGIKELPYDKKDEQSLLSYGFGKNLRGYYTLGTCDSLQKIVISDSNDALSCPKNIKDNYGNYMGSLDYFLPALKELYIGRNIDSYISNEKVKHIEFGDSCTEAISTKLCRSLEQLVYGRGISSINTSYIPKEYENELYVKASTPPTVSGTFANKTYMNAKLYVPKESLEEYKKADVWKDFWNIEGYDFSSGISNITVDKANKPDAIYDLQGRKLSKPQKGINIINGKKVVVK